MLAPLERAPIPVYNDVQRDMFSSHMMDQNPLLDVKIPSAIIDPDTQNLNLDPLNTPLEPSAVLGPDAQDLAPPSFNPPAALKPVSRNPLRDIKLPNAIVSPDFQDVKPPSTSPTMHSARSFNSLACPPQLLPIEWNSFTSELERAAASSGMARTSFEIAIGIARGVGYPTGDGNLVWGKWHRLPVQREGDEEDLVEVRGDEGVTAVVERFNGAWADRAVRVALEIRERGRKLSNVGL